MRQCPPAVAAVGPQTVPGLTRQTRPPDDAFTGRFALERALTSGADWIWLLARGANPRVDALERLLDARALPGETPASLLAGTVVDVTGGNLACQLPAGDARHTDLVRLVGKRALPIRNTTFANCLAARDCFLHHGLPDELRYGSYAAVEWSARALREETGYFIPSSIVLLDMPASRRDAVRSIPALVRMLRTGAWTRSEALNSVTTSLAISLRPRTASRGAARTTSGALPRGRVGVRNAG